MQAPAPSTINHAPRASMARACTEGDAGQSGAPKNVLHRLACAARRQARTLSWLPGPARVIVEIVAKPMQAKGTAVVGTVAAMKANEALYRKALPEHLQHYLDEPVLVSGWYPMEDYLELLKVLAANVDPKLMGGDAYRAFGIIAARRDLKGIQTIPEDHRVDRPGLYRSAVDSELGLSGRIRRGLWLRSLYYSSGHYEATRAGERTLRLVLRDFPVISAELCRVGTGYLIELFHQPPKGWVEKLSCRALGRGECAWEVRFDSSADPNELLPFGEVPGKGPGPAKR